LFWDAATRIIDAETGDAAAVDPVWPEQVLQAAQLEGANVKAVLTTHHHWDHAGGNNGMKKLLKDVKVYGGVKDKVEGCTHSVQHHDEFPISSSIRVKALETSWYVSFFPWTPHNGLSLYSPGVCGLIFVRPHLLFDSLVWMYAVILRGTSATL
jgi:hypothetical protein